MKKILIIAIILGLIVISMVAGTFYVHVGLGNPISKNSQDWNSFGGYFGGVVGALFSFISIILVTSTIRLQSEQLSDSQHETIKRDHLAHVTKVEEEINRWLERRLATRGAAGSTTEFGDVVWGICKPNYINSEELKTAIKRLHKLTSLYCESLALYRDNIDTHFIYRYHRQKAQSLVDFLRSHSEQLGQSFVIALAFCQNHLDGSQEA
jgi:hypothetical protein